MRGLRSAEEAEAAWRLGEQEELFQRANDAVEGRLHHLAQQKLSISHLEELIVRAVVLADNLLGIGARLYSLERRVAALERRLDNGQEP